MRIAFLLVIVLINLFYAKAQILRRPIPGKLVVLTFDDGVVSHANFVAPLLKKYGFGATFFICEFPPDFDDKSKYMSWEQMQELDKMGFEVANHTWHHKHVNKLTEIQLKEEIGYIENKCKDLGIRTPLTSFAYPGYDTHPVAFKVLKEKGYQFARTGGDRAYDPEKDHPYLVPGFTTGTDKRFIFNALEQAKDGKIVVLTIHGVPDSAHPWVNTPPQTFEDLLRYLKENRFQVIAMRDLANYINVEKAIASIKPNG